MTQKTAWFMLQRIRLALQDPNTGGKLGGEVEIDETFIGGKSRFMHKSKRDKLGISKSNSMAGKVAVMGLLERHGEGKTRVRTEVITSRKRNQLEQSINAHVEAGSTIYTDALKSYDRMGEKGYVHQVIDHAEASMSKPFVSTGATTTTKADSISPFAASSASASPTMR